MALLAAHLRAPLTRRFQLALDGIGAQSATRVQGAWSRLDRYDEAQVEEFTRLTASTMGAAKAAAVHSAVGYYSLTAGVRPVPVRAADVPVIANMREPFISTWRAFKSGESFENAIAAGSARAEAVVRNLVTSSSRQTGDVVADRSELKILGWERIPDGDACEWCLTVAPGPMMTNGIAGYTTAETADFGHDRCGCTVEPILD